jgi:hypothetical protein
VGERERRRRRGRAAWLVLAALAAPLTACSLRFDSAGDAWRLLGAPVDTAGLQRLSIVTLQVPRLVAGADGATWATTGLSVTTEAARLGLVRLGSPATSEVIEGAASVTAGAGSWFEIGQRAIYGYYPGGVLIHRPGAHARRVDLPAQDAGFSHSPTDAAFSFQDGQTLHLERTDGSYQRRFDTTGTIAGDLVSWSDDGDHAVVMQWRETDHKFSATIADSRSEALLSLADYPQFSGVPPFGPLQFVADPPTALLCTDAAGLLALPLDGSAPRVLDAQCSFFPVLFHVCGPDVEFDCTPWLQSGAFQNYATVLSPSATRITYDVLIDRTGTRPRWETRTTALDGSRGATTPAHTGDATALAPPHVATIDLSGYRFAYSIAASVDGRPTMERGRALTFSADGTRVRFLEHTADLNGVGDLMTGPVGGPYQLVARNSLRYQEIDDRRLIAVTNAAYGVGRARVVLVDEAAGTVSRLVEGADAYVVLPGNGEALVRLQSSDYGAPDEWLRVPLPPPRGG